MFYRHRREEGAVAIIVAILLVVLMAAVALAVDVGGLYLRRRELVNGADAAALSAARTCSRFGHVADEFPPVGGLADTEGAADHGAALNSGITEQETAGTNVTDQPAQCGLQYGHVSVSYTSFQSLYFAPVLGFRNHSPVTTTATASWGLGSNNPLPMMLTASQSSTCPLPPAQGAVIDQTTCAFWLSDDAGVGASNWTFLSLNPEGWDVAPDGNCPGSQAGGTSRLTSWINGEIPVSVALNWTDPTYVCTDTGLRGLGNGNGTSQLWRAVQDLAAAHAVKDFPINWMGPESPKPGIAPAQGVVPPGGTPQVDKYDIIGFARMMVLDAVQGTPSNLNDSCTVEWTAASPKTQSLACFPPGSTWNGYTINGNHFCTNTPAAPNFDCTIDSLPNGGGHTTATVNYIKSSICGPAPDSNAWCLVLRYEGSTLNGDYPSEHRDDITVVRLCDGLYHSCLDERHPNGV